VVPSLARSGATVLSQAIRSAGQFATQALRSGGQIISQAIRTAGQAASQSIRTAGQVARRTSGGGGGGGGGGGFRQDSFGARLTERADIYMHMNALKNLARTANSLLEIGTSFRENSVAIEVFVGSAEKANAVMKDIRDFAIQSPYMFTDLAEEARNMMAYGVSAEQTMDLMKSLGDIAGGNSRRFGLLAYAMSQIVSLGKLQGNELRQLTEQGFNPLKTIAERTLKPMQTLEERMSELFEAKEKGLITSKHVIDALRIETSEGGHFAGTMNRMSNELGGLMNRIRETFQTSILLKIYTILEEDLKNLARRTLEYLNRLEEWIEKNPKLVKQIAETAKNAFMLLAAFNALGLAVAVIAWNLNKVSTLFSIFKMLTSPLYSVLTSLVGVFMTLGSVLSSIVTLNVMGLISSIGGLLQIAAAFGAVGMGVALVRDYIKGAGGLSGALRQIQEDLNRLSLFSKGFFANFQENFQILTDWIRKNWKELSQFLGETMNSMLKALLHNIGVLAEAMVKLIVASFHWLKTNLPGIIKEITAAVAEGFGATQERGMAMAATGVNAMGGPQGTLASMAASIPMWIAEQGLERDEYNRQRNEKVLEIARKEGLDTTPRSRGRAEASRILDQMEARGEWSYVPRGRMFMPPGSNVPGAKEGVNLGQEAANIGASVLDRLKSGLEGMGNAADRLKALGIEMPALNLTIPEGKPAELPPGMPVPPAFKDYDFSGLEGGPGAIGRGRGRGVEDLTAFTYESGSYRAKMAEFASRVKAEGAGANPQLSAQLTANNILLKILGALTGGGATPPDANNTISPANLNAVGAP
jgi:tape measure domain-containing protein